MTRFSFYEPTAVANTTVDESIDAGADMMSTVRASDFFLTISHSETISSEMESTNSGKRALNDSISEGGVTWKKSSSNHCATDSFYQVNRKHFIEDQETHVVSRGRGGKKHHRIHGSSHHHQSAVKMKKMPICAR